MRTLQVSEIAGGRAILVRALDEKARKFYYVARSSIL